MRSSEPDLPQQLVDAIRQAWPDGVIDMPSDLDEASFWDVYPKLKASLSRIAGTAAMYEREPQAGPQWDDVSDPGQDPPDWDAESRSYHLFFLPLVDGRFRFETDTLEPGEDGIERRVADEGRIGCAVGISLIAPFAIVTLDQMEVFEDGSRSEPDIQPHIFDLDGRAVDMDEHFKEMVEDEGLAILRKVRADVVSILNQHQIAVISGEDLAKPVPWLRAGSDVFLGGAGEPITVRDAFFFHGP